MQNASPLFVAYCISTVGTQVSKRPHLPGEAHNAFPRYTTHTRGSQGGALFMLCLFGVTQNTDARDASDLSDHTDLTRNTPGTIVYTQAQTSDELSELMQIEYVAFH